MIFAVLGALTHCYKLESFLTWFCYQWSTLLCLLCMPDTGTELLGALLYASSVLDTTWSHWYDDVA